MKITKKELQRIVREELYNTLNNLPLGQEELTEEEETRKEKLRGPCFEAGYYSLDHLLRIINRINLASKGSLSKAG